MSSGELLKQGIAASKAGRRAEARELFLQALKLDQDNEQAWLWLSGVVDTDVERRTCLEEVLALNPANAVARQGLEHLQAMEPKPIVATEPQAIPHAETISGFGEPIPAPASIDRLPGEPERPVPGAKERRDQGGVDWLVIVGGAGLVGVICVVVVMLIALLGAREGQKSAPATESPAAITSVVYANLAAHNAEDVERYMATIHSQAPKQDEMRELLEEMYRTYDIMYTISGVELLKVSGDRAEVSFTLITRKVRGPSFRDNRVVGVFILRKEDDGQWKLFDQKIDDIEYLD